MREGLAPSARKHFSQVHLTAHPLPAPGGAVTCPGDPPFRSPSRGGSLTWQSGVRGRRGPPGPALALTGAGAAPPSPANGLKGRARLAGEGCARAGPFPRGLSSVPSAPGVAVATARGGPPGRGGPAPSAAAFVRSGNSRKSRAGRRAGGKEPARTALQVRGEVSGCPRELREGSRSRRRRGLAGVGTGGAGALPSALAVGSGGEASFPHTSALPPPVSRGEDVSLLRKERLPEFSGSCVSARQKALRVTGMVP